MAEQLTLYEVHDIPVSNTSLVWEEYSCHFMNGFVRKPVHWWLYDRFVFPSLLEASQPKKDIFVTKYLTRHLYLISTRPPTMTSRYYMQLITPSICLVRHPPDNPNPVERRNQQLAFLAPATPITISSA